MIWEVLAVAVVLGFVGAGALSTLWGRADLLLLQAIVALALGGFNVYALGTVWFPIKVVSSWALVLVLVRLLMNRHPERFSAGFAIWFLLACWVVVAGLFGFVVDAPLPDDLGSGLLSAALRPIVQTYTYLSLLALTPLALMGLRTEADHRRFWSFYAITATASCAVALVQWAMLRAGLAFMPILRMHGEHSQAAAFDGGESVVYRLYGFAGEPKALAVLLVPIVFAALMATLQPRQVRPWWGHPAMPVAFALVTILTYSTAALIALAVGALLTIVLTPWAGARGGRVVAVVFTATLGASALMVLVAVYDVHVQVLDLIHLRTVERLETQIFERRETAALAYLFEERPELALNGLGLGMFIYHFPGLLWGEGTDVIQSGWVTSLVDLGLLGTALVLALCASAVLDGASAAARLAPSQRIFLAGAMGALVGCSAMHLGWNVFGLLTLFVGVLRATTGLRPGASLITGASLINARVPG